MTAPPPSDPVSVAVALAELRGDLGTGVAEIKGSLALLVQRAGQTDQTIAGQREDLDAVEVRLTSVERRMWAASGGAAVLGTIAGYAVQFLGK
ncbi:MULTISPECIES: hypothetical protein [unclassified Streptomyces]|uniref:hypothetical protein n=1 Tax=unclassified Streptomyces TaxID=2593676 RepID=UPI003D94979F